MTERFFFNNLFLSHTPPIHATNKKNKKTKNKKQKTKTKKKKKTKNKT
jgi:hypothetical protein